MSQPDRPEPGFEEMVVAGMQRWSTHGGDLRYGIARHAYALGRARGLEEAAENMGECTCAQPPWGGPMRVGPVCASCKVRALAAAQRDEGKDGER